MFKVGDRVTIVNRTRLLEVIPAISHVNPEILEYRPGSQGIIVEIRENFLTWNDTVIAPYNVAFVENRGQYPAKAFEEFYPKIKKTKKIGSQQ